MQFRQHNAVRIYFLFLNPKWLLYYLTIYSNYSWSRRRPLLFKSRSTRKYATQNIQHSSCGITVKHTFIFIYNTFIFIYNKSQFEKSSLYFPFKSNFLELQSHSKLTSINPFVDQQNTKALSFKPLSKFQSETKVISMVVSLHSTNNWHMHATHCQRIFNPLFNTKAPFCPIKLSLNLFHSLTHAHTCICTHRYRQQIAKQLHNFSIN